jgi:hypothetical protein
MSEQEQLLEGSLEEAKKVLTEANQKKVAECGRDIQKALQEHGCRIEVAMVITPQGNIPQMKIVPVN